MSDHPEPGADPDCFRALCGEGRAQIKRKGSRFIGRAHGVDSEEQAEAIVDDYRSQYHDARHVCYGLRVGLGARRIDRSNDDGEPPRTGGFPIWQVLSGRRLENSLVVVIRYFGGIKLGMGGLKRAYRDAARAALQDADTTIVHPETRLRVTVPYATYDALERLIEDLEATRLTDREFTADVDVEIAVWTSRFDEVARRLSEFLGRSVDDVTSST